MKKILINNNKTSKGLGKSVLLIFILSMFLVVFQMVMQNNKEAFAYIWELMNPLLLLFNIIPIFLVMLLLYFITNRVWAGFLGTSVPLTIMLIINKYKIFFRNEPFKPADMSLGGEMTNIMQNYTIEFDPKIWVLSLIVLVVFLLIMYFVRNDRISPKIRVICSVSTVVCLILSNTFIYSNDKLYKQISAGPNVYNDVSIYSSKGFLYSFLVNASGTAYEKPEGYSKKKVDEILKPYQVSGAVTEKKMPNVIAIMSEAFFDPQKAENVEFYPGMNPMDGMNELKKESYYGDLLVPGFAGSTASTEFEFLTGASLPVVSRSLPTVYKMINSDVLAIPRVFKSMGYSTLAIHPGHKWFYNRQNVYDKMEFDDFISEENLQGDAERINYYVSDNVAADIIIDNYKKHLDNKPNSGYFNFTVTIQNHGPYMDHQTDREPIYVKPDGMDDKLYNTINNYFAGLKDANDLLVKVKNYIDTVDEPTVIVFFGDHLPYLDSELKGYEYMGYDVSGDTPESILNRYSVPYLICSNDSAKDLIKDQGGSVFNGKGKTISSNFLAVELMKYMNMDLPPYFSFVNSIGEEVQAIGANYYLIDGKFETEVSDDIKKKLNDYKILQYDNLQR